MSVNELMVHSEWNELVWAADWGHSFRSWCVPYMKKKQKNLNKSNPLKQMKERKMTPDVRLYSSNEHRGVTVPKTTLPFLPCIFPIEWATDKDTCTQCTHPSIHYSPLHPPRFPFNSTIRLSRGSSLQSLQPVNSKLINNGAITIVRTKAERCGWTAFTQGERERKKERNTGFFIINCQSFAKIKASLSLHRGLKPTVCNLKCHFALVLQKKHKYAVSWLRRIGFMNRNVFPQKTERRELN